MRLAQIFGWARLRALPASFEGCAPNTPFNNRLLGACAASPRSGGHKAETWAMGHRAWDMGGTGAHAVHHTPDPPGHPVWTQKIRFRIELFCHDDDDGANQPAWDQFALVRHSPPKLPDMRELQSTSTSTSTSSSSSFTSSGSS